MVAKRVAILTGGGDCPGLNAVIRGVTKTAISEYGWEVIGIHDGFAGLVEGHTRELHYDDVSNILHLGGTILGTSNKADPFAYYGKNGKVRDRSKDAIANLKNWGVSTLFCVGGDGTLNIAHRFSNIWRGVIGIPKTIDNDLAATDQTVGFDTACNFVTDALDRLHSTAQSHHRVMVIEVMGRYAGWIALSGGLAGGGDIILIPEMPFEIEKIANEVKKRSRRGKKFTIIVVAEGACQKGGSYAVRKIVEDSPDKLRLGGIGNIVADQIEQLTGHEARVTVLGHLQRGGSPTFFDRVLGTRYGVAAAGFANDGKFGIMAALKGREIVTASLKNAASDKKTVPLSHPLISAARAVGTSFGI